MTRICITGGPRTGKTTLANSFELHDETCPVLRGLADCACKRANIRHTDDLIEQCEHLGRNAWSEASLIVNTWLDAPGPWIIEGVAVSRALRKWRDANPGERPPVDRVIYLHDSYEILQPGQTRMTKGVRAVHDEIEPWLTEHGLVTEYL